MCRRKCGNASEFRLIIIGVKADVFDGLPRENYVTGASDTRVYRKEGWSTDAPIDARAQEVRDEILFSMGIPFAYYRLMLAW